MKLLIVWLCPLVLVVKTHGLNSPAGYMSDCPGMNKNTTVTASTKNSLNVVLVYQSSGFLGMPVQSQKKCAFSEKGAECVAKNLDLRKRTQVILAGYLLSVDSPPVRVLVTPYLKRGSNVIVVQLFPLLLRTYPLAARLTKPMGTLLGEFLAALTRQGLRSRKLHLLGASLGAHIASRGGHVYYNLTGQRPARLTGLDPAGPCFRNLPRSERFNSDAARKVDALHTNIDGFGLADPSAHVDFYANGGEYQPSMTGNFIMPCFLLCSHSRALSYWVNAHTHTDQFVGVRCDSVSDVRHGNCYTNNITTNVLGPKTDFNKKGIYFLPTTEKQPYYIGNKALTSRQYGSNNYLLQTASDDHVVV